MKGNVPVHAEALNRLDDALADPAAVGAIVLGPDGVGKSTLVAQAADRYAAAHPDAVIRRVTGTPTEAAVPFGAFSHLVEIAEVGKPAALLRAARLSLRAGPTDLLIIDDANQLDALSATLVYQLALAGQTRMVVTARADTAPEPIRALTEDGLLRRIDVEATDAAPDIDAFLIQLPPPVRAVLDQLAVREPIPLADLQILTSPAAVHDAVRTGAAEVLARGDSDLVYSAHPQFNARIRAALDPDTVRAIRTALVPLTAARMRDHPGDRLRLAELALGSDAPLPATDTEAAAAEALRLGDTALAERLSRAVLRTADTVTARVLLGQALGWQGRGREADEVLAAVSPDGLSEPELIGWALPRAANQFWMLGEPERATAFLHNIRDRLSAGAARLTVDALSATFAMNAGNLTRAMQLAQSVLASDDADDTAVAWAASAAALCSARAGRFEAVDALVRRAAEVEHPGLLRFTAGLAQIITLVMAGDHAAARETAQQYTDFAELQQPGRAIGEVLLGYVLLSVDDFAAAATLLAPASAILERTGYSWALLALTLQATALARAGDLPGAAKVLARADARHGTKSAIFAPELGIARAWRLAASRDEHGALGAARAAASMAERSGQAAVAVRCWIDALDLGDTHVAIPLERVAAQADCVVARDALAHARGQRLR